MSKLFYFLATFAESGLSVVGIRSAYDQPKYTVTQTISSTVEVRAYAPRAVVETDMGSDPGQAFGKLFRYITGANTAAKKLGNPGTVEQGGSKLIAMTVPVEVTAAAPVMRFYLAPNVVAEGIPVPTEKGVRTQTLPAVTLGVIRYSGVATDTARAQEAGLLRAALAKAGRATVGEPVYFSYDPPFTVPFLRRNEVAIEVK
jgi:hypothetical protein